MRKLIYLSASVLPSTAANSVNVMKMSDAFAAAGMQVTLVGIEGSSPKSTDFELRRAYGVSDNFRIHRVSQSRILGHRLRYAFGILFGEWAPRDSIVYTRVPKIASLSARLGRQCVLELHHPPSAGNLSDVKMHLSSVAGGKLVVITASLKDWVIRNLSVSDDCVIVAPDGADPFPLDVAPASPFSGRFRIGYLGHLYPGKGVEIIARLAPRMPEIDFLVVGGTDEDILRWQTKTVQCSNLRFVGRVPHSETTAWLRSFDIALLPNQVHVGIAGNGVDIGRWTSPLKAFEYMAAGLPIVASDLENLREVFVDGENAVLCNPESVDDWEASIRRLVSDAQLRGRLGATAKRWFEAKYTWAARARNICDLLWFESEQRF